MAFDGKHMVKLLNMAQQLVMLLRKLMFVWCGRITLVPYITVCMLIMSSWRCFQSYIMVTSVSETIRKPPLVKAWTALKTKQNKLWRKRFSICRMEFLHPAMWHNHDIDFARWLHPAMWHVALDHDSEFTKWQHPAMWCVALGWHAVEFARWQQHAMWHVALDHRHWIRQVAAPCNVAGGSGMTCHGIRPNVRRIGILHLVSILTISPQWTCHMSFCTSLRNFVQIGPPSAEKNDVVSIFKMADLSHFGF